MKTNVCFHDVDVPKIGYEFHLVDVTFTNTGETRRDGYTKIQRTNMSGEPREKGWLGTTDNVDKQALGKYRVVRVLGKSPKYWNQGVRVQIEKV